MTMIKAVESAAQPPQEFLDAMAEFVEEGIKSGVVVDLGGLAPSAMSARVRLSGGKLVVTDGPFTEAKELVGGYAIIEASSKDEAIELAAQLVNLHKELWPGWEGETEIRPLLGPEAPTRRVEMD
ncbi:MAG TPA: YciI family protein [Jiangellaceae bacterium]|nr:YciI family protein [Jiangellaceae bacterium]